MTFVIPPNNRYIVINLHLFTIVNTIAVRTKSKITNFNVDLIQLPMEDNQIKYRIHSFIIHIGDSLNSGHYYIWTRNLLDPGGIQLNDSCSRKLKKMYSSLEKVNCIILEQM